MEMSPNTSIPSPISFDEEWEVLSPAVQVMLAHLHRAAHEAKHASVFPVVHLQSS